MISRRVFIMVSWKMLPLSDVPLARALSSGLNARQAQTGRVNVVYDPRVARGIASHLASAINGASVARKTSFLKDRMGDENSQRRYLCL